MNIHDYLIEHDGLDWEALMEEWRWLLPREFTVRVLTRAGDLFIELPDRSVHILEVGAGELRRVADSSAAASALLARPEVAHDWLMVPVVDRLVASGRLLGAGQCYGFRLLPVLGGSYNVDDRVVLPIHEHFGACGSLHRQIAELPDGAQVRLEVTE